MPETVFVWIIGLCIVLCAAAMITQAAAGFELLRIIKPLIEKKRQMLHESKTLVDTVEATLQVSKPKIASMRAHLSEFGKIAAADAVARKNDLADLLEPFRRRALPKPRRIRTYTED